MPQRYSEYEVYCNTTSHTDSELLQMLLTVEAEPVSLDEALSNPHWKEAMKEELRSIRKE